MSKRRKKHVKALYRESPRESPKESHHETEKKISTITKKLPEIKYNNKIVVPVIIVTLILVSMFYAYDVRSAPKDLEITNTWAANSINQQIRAQAVQVISQQYPNLPQAQANELIDQQVTEAIRQMGDSYNQQVLVAGQSFRERLQIEMPDGKQQTYLLAIDPYYHLWRTTNYLENGHAGDYLKDGQPWHALMTAPIGGPANLEFHNVFAVLWHNIYKIFNPGSELIQSLFWLPVITAMLAVIPAFFIAYRKTNYLGGFIAAMLVAVHPYALSRTAAGFSDTDAYNILFPLLITWMILEAFTAKSVKMKTILTSLSGMAVGLFAFAWNGWWYMFDFVLIGIAAYIWYVATHELIDHNWIWYKKVLYFLGSLVLFPATAVYYFMQLYKKSNFQKKFKNYNKPFTHSFLYLITFIVSSFIFVGLFLDFGAFFNAFTSPLGFTTIQNAAHGNLWPNVFTTVAELNRSDIPNIVNNVGFGLQGGIVFFFLAILGIGFSFINKNPKGKDWIVLGVTALLGAILVQDLTVPIFWFMSLLVLIVLVGVYFAMERDIQIISPLIITIWFIGTIYASTLGIRFILLLVPAFGVAIGLGAGKFSQILEHFTNKEMNFKGIYKAIIPTALFILLTVILLSTPINAGNSVGEREVPSFDDAWYDSLKSIEADSEPNAIITSWWDFGHWFKAMANRPVTFDGASQNSPQAHWVGRMFSTPNEDEALGILRMLDCGASTGNDEVQKVVGDPLDAVLLTKEIILLDKADAEKRLLQEGFNSEQVNKVLPLTHCVPPEAYVITSGDMVGKSGVWSHFGNWDFGKAFVYNGVNNKPPVTTQEVSEKLGVTTEEADALIFTAKGISDREANNWIGPFAGYFGSQTFGCSEDGDILICTFGLGLGSAGGQSDVLERVFFDTKDPDNTTVLIGRYNEFQQRIGGAEGNPSAIVYTTANGLERITYDSATLPVDVIIDTERNLAALAAPEVSEGLFTRLYFLNGYGADHFEMISDRTSVFGNKILVWKVNWPEEFMEE